MKSKIKKSSKYSPECSAAAQVMSRAGSIYVAQLRAMMAPLFCTVNVLSHLTSAQQKFKQAIEQNVGFLPARDQSVILTLMAHMIAIHDDELAARLPFIAKKYAELKEVLARYQE